MTAPLRRDVNDVGANAAAAEGHDDDATTTAAAADAAKRLREKFLMTRLDRYLLGARYHCSCDCAVLLRLSSSMGLAIDSQSRTNEDLLPAVS